MVVEKNIELDLNRIIPMKTITIHQGDQNSINLVITLTNDSKSVNLIGKGDMCYLSGKVPLINGWRVVYYSLPVYSISSSMVLGKIDNDYFSISTSTLENHSVIELKRFDNSLMGSGEIEFTLIYKYK